MQRIALILSLALIACATPADRLDPLSQERSIGVVERNGDLEFVSEPGREQFADFFYREVRPERPEFRIGLERISAAMQQSTDWVLLRREMAEHGRFQVLLAYRHRDGAWRSISLISTQVGLALRDETSIQSPLQFERDLSVLGASDLIFQMWPRSSHEASPYWITIHKDGQDHTHRVAPGR